MRTRLTFGYKWDRVTFGASIQDVRVWGQDASTISNADGNRLMLHEGWADIMLANKAFQAPAIAVHQERAVGVGIEAVRQAFPNRVADGR